ncbi:MAG: His/Gly/Thr/Pro-type tRNA ligase C-terminal domain-containing protein [Candidatus Marsarchaeota archaeon]|nr:His/Gly/Thr/Pro-type tRNA ligase C-terminal domain-containing protein [Candidatus Marsarchaeota archaeon]
MPIIKSTSNANILKEAEILRDKLISHGIEAEVDASDITAGKKFHIWEIKGVPVRIEMGEKEVAENTYTIFRRDQNKKYKIEKSNVVKVVEDLINKDIPKELLDKAKAIYSEKIVYVNNLEDAKTEIYKGRVAKAIWCEEKVCFEKISSLGPSIEPIGSLVGETKEGKCIACAKAASKLTLFGRTY